MVVSVTPAGRPRQRAAPCLLSYCRTPRAVYCVTALLMLSATSIHSPRLAVLHTLQVEDGSKHAPFGPSLLVSLCWCCVVSGTLG